MSRNVEGADPISIAEAAEEQAIAASLAAAFEGVDFAYESAVDAELDRSPSLVARNLFNLTLAGDDDDADNLIIHLGEWPADTLTGLLNACSRIEAAANEAKRRVETELASRLENHDLLVGQTLYRWQETRRERLVDPDALAEFLGDDWQAAIPLSESTRIRKGGLDAVAAKRGLDPQTVRDTFLAVEYGTPALQTIPVDKAPKFALKMTDGELRPRVRR